MLSYHVAPSILGVQLVKPYKLLQKLRNEGMKWLHLDYMDGCFVPNFGVQLETIDQVARTLDEKCIYDAHLMVNDPQQDLIQNFAHSNVNQCTFHYEATSRPEQVIQWIRETNMTAGIALSPATPLQKALPLIESQLQDLELVLIMSVEPGKGGQRFQPSCLEKVRVLRQKFPQLNIQVDGGINHENLHEIAAAGANLVVAGSSIFKAEAPVEAFTTMQHLIQAHKSTIGSSSA